MEVGSTPKRVHIMGMAGAGKTTLAERVGARLGVEHIDLDSLPLPFLDGDPDVAAAWRAAAAEIAAGPAWVTASALCGWTDPLLEAADVIVWLDTPPPIAVWRIVRRHAVRSAHGTNPHKGLWLLARFLRDVMRYPGGPIATDEQLDAGRGNSGATTRDRLAPYPDKVVRCRGNRDLDRLLSALGS